MFVQYLHQRLFSLAAWVVKDEIQQDVLEVYDDLHHPYENCYAISRPRKQPSDVVRQLLPGDACRASCFFREDRYTAATSNQLTIGGFR